LPSEANLKFLRLPRVCVATLMALCLAAGVPISGYFANATLASAASIPACSGANFWGGYVGSNGEAGSVTYTVALINDGHTTCRLSGYPTVDGYKNGHEYSLSNGHLKDAPYHITATNLAPRMSGVLVLMTAVDCNALNTGGQTSIQKETIAHTYENISIEFPNSTDRVYINGIDIDEACGLTSTQLGWQH
jgi:Protein of unknown function (DUF4232)